MNFDLDQPAMAVAEETFALSKIEQAQITFEKYKDAVSLMNYKASNLAIVDAETNQMAIEMAGQSAAMYKIIEDKRKETVKAPNDFIKAVNQFAKQYTSALEAIKATLGQKITRYYQEQTRARLEAQRKANETAKALQDEIDKAAAEVGETASVVITPVVLESPKVTRTASGSATQTTTWTFEVEDFAALPDEYKLEDKVGLNKAVKAGLRQIPGVKIYQVQGVRIRSASLPKWDDDEKF